MADSTVNSSMSVVHLTSDAVPHSEYSSAKIYGYGTASVAIISCLSLLGISLFPALKSRHHEYFVQFFIAFGAGTMTSDALIYVIPDALGVEDQGNVVAWKMSVVYGGILLFFIFENGLRVWKKHRTNILLLASKAESEAQKSVEFTSFRNIQAAGDGTEAYGGNISDIKHTNQANRHEEDWERSPKLCWCFTTIVFAVFVGDIVHNMADGIARGVSFSSSANDGIGTSIAVLCHKIPHEFGDFIIHLKNGASKWQAIGLNVIATFSGFIGLYIGIALSQDESLRQWLLAILAGMFLYIALVQVIVELAHHTSIHPVMQFVIQVFGLLVGWTVILLLRIYKQDIETSLSG